MAIRSRIFPYIILLSLLAFGLVYLLPFLFPPPKALNYSDVIASPGMNAMVPSGKSLDINLIKENLEGYDSIKINLERKPFQTLKGSYQASIPTEGLPLGKKVFAVVLYKNGETQTFELPFVVVSDITPVNLPFTKVRENLPHHDGKVYTQGFEIHNGFIYESGGQYGASSINKLDKSGKVLQTHKLEERYFAEGLTILGGKVYQLTWKEGVCLIYDENLKPIGQKPMLSSNGELWGACNDGKSLIISDGSNRLTFLNPETFAVEKSMEVFEIDKPSLSLNELEYVDGFIYANIYLESKIVKIEAATGKVVATLDLTSLKAENPTGEVLNGITYDQSTKTFYVTGKNWPKMYEIKL